ncbi:MAG: glycoside hydrolase family 18 protein [Fimbriimonadaceae bacterium]|nr:glycoside hydrolase family 18 protein [Fimbriimonadaceae bacterium]
MLVSAMLAVGLIGAPQAPGPSGPPPGTILAPRPRPQEEPAFTIAGYMPSWRFGQVDLSRLKGVTDVIAFSLRPDADGALDPNGLTSNHFAQLRQGKRTAGFRTWISIGGWGLSEGFPALAASPKARQAFFDEANALMRREGIDGIDFDWEYPRTPADFKNFTTLVTEAKAYFSRRGRLVGAALPAWLNVEPAALKALDRIFIMSYDYPERHSTLEQARTDIDAMIARGAPPERLVLGIPFYGRNLTTWSSALGWADISSRFSPKPEVDEAGGYFFNGPATVLAKRNLARERKIAGVMVWELGHDAPTGISLMQVLIQGRIDPRPLPRPAPRRPGSQIRENRATAATPIR